MAFVDFFSVEDRYFKVDNQCQGERKLWLWFFFHFLLWALFLGVSYISVFKGIKGNANCFFKKKNYFPSYFETFLGILHCFIERIDKLDKSRMFQSHVFRLFPRFLVQVTWWSLLVVGMGKERTDTKNESHVKTSVPTRTDKHFLKHPTNTKS